MRPAHQPTPAEIIGELLTRHPEAASLLAEASHCRALAACSAATTAQKFAAAQSARLAYEELRHRLEPRRQHPVHFGVGLSLLLVLGIGLVMLVFIELSGPLGGLSSVLPAIAAVAVLLTLAWLGAVTVRQRRWSLVTAIVGTAVLLGLSLAAVHGVSPHPGWPTARENAVFGALTGAFILVLATGAAVLIAYMEPASLLPARHRWHRARAAYERAVETERADAEAAAVATEAWLGLVRAWVTRLAASEERLIQDTVTFAAVLLESGRPQLPQADLAEEGEVMQSDHNPMPSQILHELLASHLEAAGLQAEAIYRRALSMHSAARVDRESAAVQAARLSYDQLRNRLAPRGRRTIRFGAALLLLGLLGTVLAVLDTLELGGFLPGSRSILLSLAATAVWLTMAWLAAVAGREQQWTTVAATVGKAVVLAALVAALHGTSLRSGGEAIWRQTGGNTVSGILYSVSLLAAGVGTAVVIVRMEPVSLLAARHRLRRARARYEDAVRVEQADVEAASMAAKTWLDLVRTEVRAISGEDENVVREAVSLAAVLLEQGRPGVPPPLHVVLPVQLRERRSSDAS